MKSLSSGTIAVPKTDVINWSLNRILCEHMGKDCRRSVETVCIFGQVFNLQANSTKKGRDPFASHLNTPLI